ncbi:Gp15 family bacteriophage protein [Streptococcus salivarius]
MLDLSRKLTDKLVIDDKEYALDLSFDNVLKLFEMMRDEDIPEYVKPHFAIRMLISKSLEGETREEKAKAFNDAFENFSVDELSKVFKSVFEEHIGLSNVEDNHVEYDLAGNPMKTTASDEPKEKAPYDIRYDGDYIYASFLQAYGIDLFDVQGKLHWKKFNALLSGLPEGTKFMEAVKIRKWKPQKGDSAEYKEEMRKLQKDYALPNDTIVDEEYEEEEF